MAAVLEPEVASSAGPQRNPLLLAILGGVHVFRALEQFRQAASHAITHVQPSGTTDQLPSGPCDHRAENRSRLVKSHDPHPSTKTITSVPAPSLFHGIPCGWINAFSNAAPGLEALSWQSTEPASLSQVLSETILKPSRACPLAGHQSQQDQRDQAPFAWEDLAALHAAAVVQAAAAYTRMLPDEQHRGVPWHHLSRHQHQPRYHHSQQHRLPTPNHLHHLSHNQLGCEHNQQPPLARKLLNAAQSEPAGPAVAAAPPHSQHPRDDPAALPGGLAAGGISPRRASADTITATVAMPGGSSIVQGCNEVRAPAAANRREALEQDDAAAAALEGKRTADHSGGGLEAQPSWLQAATVCAGAASRTLAQAAIHPLDTLKTRMQVNLANPQLRMWRAVTSCPAVRPRALLAWAGPAGLRDLFRGLTAALAGTMPASALYFATERLVRGWLVEAAALERESAPCRVVASAVAASLSALIRVPADVVKHRVQAYAYPSSAHAARNIITSRGPAGLYSGFGATLVRDVPEIVVQFTVYSQLKALLERQRRQRPDPTSGAVTLPSPPSASCTAEHVVLGGAAGAAAALLTTPLDVVKTQLQCGAAPSVQTAIAGVLRAGGPTALFGGLAPRLLQTTLCSAIFFSCFEVSKARLAEMVPPASASASCTAFTAVPDVLMAAAAAVRLPPMTHQEEGPPKTRRRCSRRGGAAATAGGIADGPQLLWEAALLQRRPLGPVAVYAYAYAGAAVPQAL